MIVCIVTQVITWATSARVTTSGIRIVTLSAVTSQRHMVKDQCQRTTIKGQQSEVNGQQSTVDVQRFTINGQRSTIQCLVLHTMRLTSASPRSNRRCGPARPCSLKSSQSLLPLWQRRQLLLQRLTLFPECLSAFRLLGVKVAEGEATIAGELENFLVEAVDARSV